MPGGRPSSYTPEIGDEVCRRIEEGATLRQVCEDEAMPPWETVRRWLRANEEFRAQYAHAREVSGEAIESRIFDEMAMADDKDSAAVARMRVDALKWIAAKRAPKVYGDRMDLKHAGDPDSPLTIQVVTGIPLAVERKG